MNQEMFEGYYAVFHSAGIPMTIKRQMLPRPKMQEILVRVEYTTLCRSDLYTYSGKRKEKSPTILGHEIVGRIESFGENIAQTDLRGNPLQIGDRVTWAIFSSDLDSSMARSGFPQKGKDLFKYGHEQLSETSCFHGGLSSHILLRPNTPVVKLDESIPLPTAAIINCAVATVSGAMRLAEDIEGKKVVISGVGMLGLVACAMCQQLGAKEIIAVDINESRLKIAQRFGATQIYTPSEMVRFGRKADSVIELSGVGSAMESSLDWLRIGGVSVWVGGTFPQESLKISSEAIIRNLITIKGLHNYNIEDFLHAVSFIEKVYENFPFQELVYDRFSLNEVEAAFTYAINQNPFRVGIKIE